MGEEEWIKIEYEYVNPEGKVRKYELRRQLRPHYERNRDQELAHILEYSDMYFVTTLLRENQLFGSYISHRTVRPLDPLEQRYRTVVNRY